MIDFSTSLTIFLITSGHNPNYPACLSALQNQTCKFELKIIKDISPMSLAFQKMLDECKTDYFIQIDEDMILQKNAIEHMYKFFEGNQSPEKIVMDCYFLKDVHLNKNIYGVKIYKHFIFKNYPFNLNHPSAEVEQLDRLKKDGYDIRFKEDVMGEHSPHWTNELIFERYYNLMNKFFLYHYSWMEKIPSMLIQQIKKNPSELNIYALAGCLAGINTTKIIDEEKNFTKKRIEYGKLVGFLEEPHQCTLYMSGDCNFKCEFCTRQHGGVVNQTPMTVEMAQKVLHKIPNIKGVALCGFGEVLLNKQLIPIIQLLKRNNKYVGLITNGSLLKEKLPEMIASANPDYISVSLNAHTKEEHEKTTKTKTWDIVIEGIKECVKSPIDTYVSHVVSTENIDEIPIFLKMVKELGVKTVHLHNILPHFDDAYNKNFWNLVLMTEHEEKINKLKTLPEADIVKAWPVLIDKNGGRKACQFPWYSFSVDGDGNLSICNSVLPTSQETFGNIDDFSFWNSTKLMAFRDKFCNGELEMCKKCFRNFSMGF